MDFTISEDDKKKLVVLGVLVGILLLILAFVFIKNRPSPSQTADVPADMEGGPEDLPPEMLGDPGAEDMMAEDNAGGEAPSTGSGNVTAASFASLGNPFADPFQPQYIMPPPPPPPPPLPLSLPTPEALPAPQRQTYIGLPPAFFSGNDSQTAMKGLPPIKIPRRTAGSRPRSFSVPKMEGGATLAAPSSGKRLSGVIIGNSVQALLEVQDASGTKTYVVQPGDTVAGIRILGITRVDAGGRTVPRLLISENGKEAYVDLRSSPNPQQDMQPGSMDEEGFPGPGSITPAFDIRPRSDDRKINPFSAY